MLGISKIIHLEETPSTNSYAHRMLEEGVDVPEVTLVYADAQTAGRGQVGNSWECAAGENVAFSLICHPRFVRPVEQFVLSEAIALAVAGSCRAVLTACGGMKEEVTVKWPNDIYYGDKKLSGTLIECYLRGGELAHCVIGTGVNVNQTVFRSDAPNPVSLKQICGHDHDREALLQDICARFVTLYNRIGQGETDEIHAKYLRHLYRSKGVHEYEDAGGRFRASILDVERTGRLLLQRTDGAVQRYEFKEVKFVIDEACGTSDGKILNKEEKVK